MENTAARRLNIVLFEPQIPQNTGNIARTCACTGARLHLVGPMGFSIDDKKLKRAGLDYWHLLDITYYEDTVDFLRQHSGDQLWFFTTKARHTYTQVSYPDDSYLIFGREDAGIQEEILVQHPDTCLRLPMISGARSLNLSNTVAIAAFEVLRQWDFPALQNEGQLHRLNWDTLSQL